MRKKRVYVESSVISYLTARPSTDIVKLTKQTQTRMWWEQREQWDLLSLRRFRAGTRTLHENDLMLLRGCCISTTQKKWICLREG